MNTTQQTTYRRIVNQLITLGRSHKAAKVGSNELTFATVEAVLSANPGSGCDTFDVFDAYVDAYNGRI